MPKVRHPNRPGLHIRIVLDGKAVVGPGRAELLERIRDGGSISAAGRGMGMSYKRCWDLVDALNALFRDPVVLAERGGEAGGGARLTPTGATVLDLYRRIEEAARIGSAVEVEGLRALMAQAEPVRAASRGRALRPAGSDHPQREIVPGASRRTRSGRQA